MGVRVCTETECGQCTRLWAYLSVFVMLVHVYNFCLPLSFVCFKWHKCIVKRHTYLWWADKQPNTNTGFFPGYQGRLIVVILNTTRGTWQWKAHYMRMTRENYLFQCGCLSLAISSLPLNLKWGMGRRSGYRLIGVVYRTFNRTVTYILLLPVYVTWVFLACHQPVGFSFLFIIIIRKWCLKYFLHQNGNFWDVC